MKRETIKKMLLFTFILFFLGTTVYAATTTKIHFCEYRGTIRLMKIIGMFILVAKTIIPIVIIYRATKELIHCVMSGKQEDMQGSVPKLAKSLIAGLVVFFIPTMINFLVDYAVSDTSNAEMTKCSNCLFDANNCKIPDKDPEVTTRD